MINGTFTSMVPRMKVLKKGREEMLDKTMEKMWVERELLEKGKKGLADIIMPATGCPLTL